MRNYVKLACCRIYPLPYDANTFYVMFGPSTDPEDFSEDELDEADEEDIPDQSTPGLSEGMQFWINYLIGLLREGNPTLQFSVAPPENIYFLLDQENLAQICNAAAGNIWSQTKLNNRFPPNPDAPLLYDVTRLEEQGSPRKTWSHGH